MVADRGYDIEGIIAMAQLRIEVSFVIELSETMLPVVWRMVFAFGVQQGNQEKGLCVITVSEGESEE